jgi:hypothetical protein
VTQDHDLDREIGVPAPGEPIQLEDTAVRLVEEREGYRRMLAGADARVKVQVTTHV